MTSEQMPEADDAAVRLGANIRRIREAAGYSQAQVADHLRACGARGAHPQMVAKLEQGTRALKFTEGLMIAGMFSVHPSELYFGEGSGNEVDHIRVLTAIRELESAREASDRAFAELRRVAFEVAETLSSVEVNESVYERGVETLKRSGPAAAAALMMKSSQADSPTSSKYL